MKHTIPCEHMCTWTNTCTYTDHTVTHSHMCMVTCRHYSPIDMPALTQTYIPYAHTTELLSIALGYVEGWTLAKNQRKLKLVGITTITTIRVKPRKLGQGQWKSRGSNSKGNEEMEQLTAGRDSKGRWHSPPVSITHAGGLRNLRVGLREPSSSQRAPGSWDTTWCRGAPLQPS